jgi:hypothetical protein
MARARRGFVLVAIAGLFVASAVDAKVRSRSCIAVAAGVLGLTGEVGGEPITERWSGRLDLGVGYQVSPRTMLEFTYGWNGTWRSEAYFALGPGEENLSEAERAVDVGTNSLMVRGHFAAGGLREGYIKPELTAALGAYHVSRLLRNVPGVPPAETSDLLLAAEIGAAMLVVFSHDFIASAGLRYALTERASIADDLEHLDNVSLVFSFRVFLPSPRDVHDP